MVGVPAVLPNPATQEIFPKTQALGHLPKRSAPAEGQLDRRLFELLAELPSCPIHGINGALFILLFHLVHSYLGVRKSRGRSVATWPNPFRPEDNAGRIDAKGAIRRK
jgi:hypothetical protein